MENRKLSELKTNPQNPRGAVIHDAKLRELAMSIKSQGVLQPIIITENDYVVAGHRRVEASKLAGLETIPVIVKKLSQLEQLQMMLVENLQRADLNVLQEGAAYKVLIEYGLTNSELSKAIGVSGERVANCIAIQALSAEIQSQFAWGSISLNCAPVLAALSTVAEQQRWANIAISQKMNGVALRDLIHGKTRAPRKPQPATSSPFHLRDMIRQLEEIDEKLEYFEGLRSAQLLIRQAVTQLIASRTTKKPEKPAAAPPGRTVDSSHSFASVASFAMRGAQVKR